MAPYDPRMDVFEQIERVRRVSAGLAIVLLVAAVLLVLIAGLVVLRGVEGSGLYAISAVLIAAVLVCNAYFVRSLDNLLEAITRFIKSRPASPGQRALPNIDRIARAVNEITETPIGENEDER